MEFQEQLRILEASHGDAGLLALAMVDIYYHELPEIDRMALKKCVEAIAIASWCNSSLLAVLTNSTKRQAEAVLMRLRKLSAIEPRPEFGPDAVGVESNVRSALRDRLSREDPRRWRALSRLAYAFFSAINTPQSEAEALSHQFASAQRIAAQEAADQLSIWDEAGQNEEPIALAAALKSTAPLTSAAREVPRVFVSYSHVDWRYCHKDLMLRIQILANRGKVELWCDREIFPGDEWDDVIRAKLEGANIFAFLVTSNFLASNYIRTKEAGRAWEKHQSGEAKIIPVLLEDCSWQEELWGGLQPVPMLNGHPKPIREWGSNLRANAWLQVEQAIANTSKLYPTASLSESDL